MFENEEEISFACRDCGLDSSVIRVISIRIYLGWISQIVINLALIIEESDFFIKHMKISSANETAHTSEENVTCRLAKVIDFFRRRKILHVKGLEKISTSLKASTIYNRML